MSHDTELSEKSVRVNKNVSRLLNNLQVKEISRNVSI